MGTFEENQNFLVLTPGYVLSLVIRDSRTGNTNSKLKTHIHTPANTLTVILKQIIDESSRMRPVERLDGIRVAVERVPFCAVLINVPDFDSIIVRHRCQHVGSYRVPSHLHARALYSVIRRVHACRQSRIQAHSIEDHVASPQISRMRVTGRVDACLVTLHLDAVSEKIPGSWALVTGLQP